MLKIDPKSLGAFGKCTPGQFACLLIQRYCYAVYDYVEKADLSKGYQNPKRKLGVTAHFSEIFGKKMPYILCILKLFLKLWLLSYFLKNAWLPTFFFLDSNNPYQDLLFPT